MLKLSLHLWCYLGKNNKKCDRPGGCTPECPRFEVAAKSEIARLYYSDVLAQIVIGTLLQNKHSGRSIHIDGDLSISWKVSAENPTRKSVTIEFGGDPVATDAASIIEQLVDKFLEMTDDETRQEWLYLLLENITADNKPSSSPSPTPLPHLLEDYDPDYEQPDYMMAHDMVRSAYCRVEELSALMVGENPGLPASEIWGASEDERDKYGESYAMLKSFRSIREMSSWMVGRICKCMTAMRKLARHEGGNNNG